MVYIRKLSNSSVGQFDPAAWIKEGDGLIASAKITRELWKKYRQEQKQGKQGAALDWNLLTGLPRASMLLLGYSVEMYLKAGLAKAYKGCSENMFSQDVKGRFGHKLKKIAQEISFDFENGDKKNSMIYKN